jgi:integrase
MHNLKRLFGGEFATLDFLADTDKILKQLESKPATTARSYLIAIVSALKTRNKPLYDFYYEHMMTSNKALKENNTKSATQETNWESWKNIEDLLKHRLSSLPKKSRKKPLTEEEYDDLLNTVILGLYVLQPPRRSQDYLNMKIAEPTDVDSNYLYSGRFYFNKYKTAKTYQTQVEPIPDALFDLLKAYWKWSPNTKYLLVDFDGKPLDRSNQITRRLNSLFGKKISSSMLRNIFLTEKFSPAIKEMKEISQSMGTSVGMIQNNYAKQDI